MTKYREILRLTALGLSLRDIESSIQVSQKTIIDLYVYSVSHLIDDIIFSQDSIQTLRMSIYGNNIISLIFIFQVLFEPYSHWFI